VGVHLASGQQKNKNHDQAMKMIVQELAAAKAKGWCIPPDENDIVIAGDFNASRFDDSEEKFWGEMEQHGWDVLADAPNYPATRLAGVPLKPKSQIDYVIVTKGNGGLGGEECVQTVAKVHSELAVEPDTFREHGSDHLPVTIRVKVMDDTDASH
jgi:endonuclease/exonuclease/phosphatase family metal-dependent hydrolase